jgi:hypothetical protein
LALIWKDGLEYNFPTSLHSDFENFITFKKTDWGILGGRGVRCEFGRKWRLVIRQCWFFFSLLPRASAGSWRLSHDSEERKVKVPKIVCRQSSELYEIQKRKLIISECSIRWGENYVSLYQINHTERSLCVTK